jgi:demethylmenaquinone methyltransferase/2-methoxy-6-polyprenyl-1,4-benzoquinol methylase
VDKEFDIHDPAYVKDLFDRVSGTYGYTNYLASFGFTERWREECVRALGKLRENAVGFDLMCGRGETWRELFATQRSISQLTALDISPEMISGARQHATTLGACNVAFLETDVFDNTIPSGSADFILSSFGVKTFNSTQLSRLAQEIARILKAGGVFSLIEVSDPKGWWLRGLYLFYLRRIMPIVERVFLGYSYGFSMIGVYVERFGDCAELKGYLEAQGLRVDLRRYFFGCATGLSGVKVRG